MTTKFRYIFATLVCSCSLSLAGCGSGVRGVDAGSVSSFGLPSSFSLPIDAPLSGASSEILTLSAPAPAGGITFFLSSDDPTVIVVPASVSVAGGATSGVIPMTALRVGDAVVHAKSGSLPELTTKVRAVYSVCTIWGDSLTEGNQDGTGVTVSTALQALGYCAKVNNEGTVGATSTQIAVREGAVASTASIVGGVIPAAGGIGISFKTGYEPVSHHALNMTIQGVAGVLTYKGGASFTFTRATSGSPTVSPADSPFTVQVGDLNSGLVVIWAGTNNYLDGTLVQSDVAAMVATLPKPSHFLVLSALNSDNPWLYAGQKDYKILTSLNASLAATYPNHYSDIRTALVGAADQSNAQDRIDQVHDVPPSTMRAQDVSGVLTTGVSDASSCYFSVTTGSALRDYTLTVDSEKIYLSSTDGTNVSGCLRGYAGTQASPHRVGAAFTGLDVSHLNGPVGDLFVARRILDWMRSH